MSERPEADDEVRDLLDRLRRGDAEARDAMYVYVADRFRPLARRLLHDDFQRVAFQSETNDVLNEALLRLVPYLERSQADFASSPGRFHALVATVLRRTLLDMIRRLYGSLQAHAIRDGIEASHPLFQESSGLNAWRERHRVHEFIERLPPAEKEAIEMKLYLGYGTGQIAACLGVHPGTISKRLASAKEKLGRMLRADDRGQD